MNLLFCFCYYNFSSRQNESFVLFFFVIFCSVFVLTSRKDESFVLFVLLQVEKMNLLFCFCDYK